MSLLWISMIFCGRNDTIKNTMDCSRETDIGWTKCRFRVVKVYPVSGQTVCGGVDKVSSAGGQNVVYRWTERMPQII